MSRVGSGQEAFEMSRVGPDRVNKFSNLAGRVGSGRVNVSFKPRGSGLVGSRGFQTLAGRVGSSQVIYFFSRVGSGQVTRPDPTRPVKFDLTREKPWYFAPTYHITRCFVYRAVPPATHAHKDEWNGMAYICMKIVEGLTFWVQTGDLQMPRAPCSRKTTRTSHAYTYILVSICILIGTYLVYCFVQG